MLPYDRAYYTQRAFSYPNKLSFARRSILLAMMSPRNEVFQAVPFDGANSDAKEPLIATGDTEEEEEKGHRLEEEAISRFKLSSSALLLGLLVGSFIALGVDCMASHFVMKSNTDVIVVTLLCSLFTVLPPFILIWKFIPYLVTITYSAVGGSSKEPFEDTVLQLQCSSCVGVLTGICLVSIIMDVPGVHVAVSPFAIMVYAFIWYKEAMASATDSKPSSTRRSAAQRTMMTV